VSFLLFLNRHVLNYIFVSFDLILLNSTFEYYTIVTKRDVNTIRTFRTACSMHVFYIM